MNNLNNKENKLLKKQNELNIHKQSKRESMYDSQLSNYVNHEIDLSQVDT